MPACSRAMSRDIGEASFPASRDRQRYMFYVAGKGARGRSAIPTPGSWRRLFRASASSASTDFPWHESGYVTPPFHEFVIYQLHVGTFFTPNLPRKGGTFLDVARKLPHLADLGVTALQLMPIQEFQTSFSLGYNGTDYFSPEMDFAVADADLAPYVAEVNGLLDAKGLTPLSGGRPARRNESAQGAGGSLPSPRAGRDPRRGLQPRGRRFRRPEPLLLRPPTDRRRASGTRSTSRTRAMPAAWCSTSPSRRCAIS